MLSLSTAALLLVGGCVGEPRPGRSASALRDINAVLADHDRELLALPGVVGVYVGTLNDHQTPCLKVMLARRDPAWERSIPQTLEGHQVVIEVTGEIRPLR